MNTNYIKVSDDSYVVANAEGKQYVITTTSDESHINTLLSKENRLEELEEQSENLLKEKEHLKNSKKQALNMHLLAPVTFGIICLAIFDAFDGQIIPIIIAGGVPAFFIEAFNLPANGTFLGRYLRNKKLNKNIDDTENEIAKLNIDIANIKKEINYDKSTSIVTTKVKPIDKSYEDELVTYKVKKLTK